MSKTYRNSQNGTRSDGGKHYSTPRYRAGSRYKQHQITAVGVKKDQPDIERLGRAIAQAALANSQALADASHPENTATAESGEGVDA